MNEEEFKDFKNYIKQYRNFTNDLVNKCITPYMLEQFRGYNDRFDYEPDLYAKYDVLGSIDNLQQKNQQLKHILDELEKWLENRIEDLDNGMYCLNVLFQRNDELLIIKDTIEKTLDKIKELRGRE